MFFSSTQLYWESKELLRGAAGSCSSAAPQGWHRCKEWALSPRSSIATGVRHSEVPGGLRDHTSPPKIKCEGHSHRRKLCQASGWGMAGDEAAGSSMRRVGVDGAETPASFPQRK